VIYSVERVTGVRDSVVEDDIEDETLHGITIHGIKKLSKIGSRQKKPHNYENIDKAQALK
jgi:cell fate (sporulation/competence/biofilm development) regulator YmcA (YheA/YmcA/DUF963 family)